MAAFELYYYYIYKMKCSILIISIVFFLLLRFSSTAYMQECPTMDMMRQELIRI